MSVRDLSYLISFTSDASGLDAATASVKELSDTLESMSTDPVDVDVNTDGVQASLREIDRLNAALDDIQGNARVAVDVEVDGLQEAERSAVEFVDALAEIGRRPIPVAVDGGQIEKVKSTLDDVTDIFDEIEAEAEAAGNAAAQSLVDMANKTDAGLRQAATAAEALSEALGESADRFDVDKVVQDLNRMGVGFDEIEADAEQFAEALKRVEAIELRQVTDGIRSADEGMRRVGEGARSASEGVETLRSRGDQTRSVLANLTGNAAQDLAEIGGVAGSAGIAISQLAEYAVDGNVSLSQLGKLAGPMVAVTAGLFAATKAVEAFGTRSAVTAEQTKAVADAAIEAAGLLEEVESRVAGLTDVAAASGDEFERFGASIFAALSGDENFEEIDRIQDALLAVGLGWEDLGETIAGLERDTLSAMPTMQALAEAVGIPPEHVEAVAAMVHNIESLDDAASFLINTWGMEEQAAIALVDKYEAQIGALEQLNDAQQNNDWDTYAQELLRVAAAADPATAALINAVEAANPDWEPGQVWAEVAGQIEAVGGAALSASDAFDEWSRSRKTFDDFPLAVDAIVKHIQEGTTNTDAFASALGVLQRAFPDMTPAQILDAIAQKIDEARLKTGEYKTESYDLAAAQEKAAAALRDSQQALDDVAASLDTIADRGDAFSAAMDTFAQFGDLGQLGETLSFADALDGLGEAVDSLVDSSVKLDGLELVPNLDNWAAIRDMPDEVRAVVDSLAGFAGNVQSEMSQAFDTGGEQGVRDWAANTRQAIVDELVEAGLDVQENADLINEILSTIGLDADDRQIDIFIQIANEDRARAVLDDISSTIENYVPPEVQLRIAALEDSNPIAALDLAIQELEARGLRIDPDLSALIDELTAGIEGYTPPDLTVPVTPQFDTAGITGALAGVQQTADANPLTVTGQADLATAETDVNTFVDGDRTITTSLGLRNGSEFDETVNLHTTDREIVVNVVLGSVPTTADIIAAITGGSGAIRLPIDAYVRHTPRIDGNALVAR